MAVKQTKNSQRLHTTSSWSTINKEKDFVRKTIVEAVMSETPSKEIRKLHECGILREILPELDILYDTPQNCRWHLYNAGVHTEKVTDMVPVDTALRLAALFHDIGKPGARKTDAEGKDHFHGHPALSVEITKTVLDRLNFGKTISEEILILVKYHDDRIRLPKKNICRYIETHPDLSPSVMEKLIFLQEADVKAHSPEASEGADDRYREIRKLYATIRSGPCCPGDLTLTRQEILDTREDKNGDTVILHSNDADVAQEMILHHILDHPEDNNTCFLKNFVKDRLKQIKNIGTDRLPEERQKQERKAYRIREKLNRLERGQKDPFLPNGMQDPGWKQETEKLLAELAELHTSHTPYLTEEEIRKRDKTIIS